MKRMYQKSSPNYFLLTQLPELAFNGALWLKVDWKWLCLFGEVQIKGLGGWCVRACRVRCAGLQQAHRDVSSRRWNEHMPLSLQARGPGASLEGGRGWPWLPQGTDQGGAGISGYRGRWGLGVRERRMNHQGAFPLGSPSARPPGSLDGAENQQRSPLKPSPPLFLFLHAPFLRGPHKSCMQHTHIIFLLFLSFFHSFFLWKTVFRTRHEACNKGQEFICAMAPWYSPLSGMFDKLLNMTALLIWQ